ncbi:MAG: DUF421 domain-containing protein [Cypionkella sp.]
MADPVVPFDLARMFFGTEPPLFYLEILFRTCVVYVYSLVLIRWVGGRGIAQMSTVEFLLVIALGSAVGDSMFYPDVPLLHALCVITVIVIINKVLDALIHHYKPIEKVIEGRTAEVIRDGVIVVETLRSAKIGRSELFQSLRQAGFSNLGEVRRGYLETSGQFSFFRADAPRAGLSVEPAWDVTPPTIYSSGAAIAPPARMVCTDCGTLLPKHSAVSENCAHCDCKAWTTASLVKRARARSAV